MEKLTPEKTIEMLREHGTIVTVQEAEKILEFLRMLAKIQVDQSINKP